MLVYQIEATGLHEARENSENTINKVMAWSNSPERSRAQATAEVSAYFHCNVVVR
jgi:hypothetical protein